MNSKRRAFARGLGLGTLILLMGIEGQMALAQTAGVAGSAMALPDAPQPRTLPVAEEGPGSARPVSADSNSDVGSGGPDNHFTPPRYATKYDKYIDEGEVAPPLTARDKFILGARTTVTPFTLISIVTSAGLEQLRNSSPNYGTDASAFGQRVGASTVRDATELIFTDSLLSPLLHEDPRYFQLGDGHNAILRTGYAISRVFVTRKDDGRITPNYALFGGFLGAIALTNAYYPPLNRGLTQNAESFGGAVGGAAFSRVFREFLNDGLQAAHLARR